MSILSQIIFVLIIFGFYVPGDGKTVLKYFKNCDHNKKDKCPFNITLKTVGNFQYADGTFVLKAPVDNQIYANGTVEMLVGNKYVHLLSLSEKKPCVALNKYMGEYWYSIQRCAQMIEGLCPLQVGRYHLHNCLLNFDKLTTLGTFPVGHLRLTGVAYDNKNNIFTCVTTEIDISL